MSEEADPPVIPLRRPLEAKCQQNNCGSAGKWDRSQEGFTAYGQQKTKIYRDIPFF